jgi:hypothetical protein
MDDNLLYHNTLSLLEAASSTGKTRMELFGMAAYGVFPLFLFIKLEPKTKTLVPFAVTREELLSIMPSIMRDSDFDGGKKIPGLIDGPETGIPVYVEKYYGYYLQHLRAKKTDISQLAKPQRKTDKREERSDLHIIGALLQEVMASGKFKSEEDLKEKIAQQYDGYAGCKPRTLSDRFKMAKDLLNFKE